MQNYSVISIAELTIFFTSSGLDDTKSANPPKVLSDFAINALLIFVAEFAKLIFQCSNNFTNIYILANIF